MHNFLQRIKRGASYAVHTLGYSIVLTLLMSACVVGGFLSRPVLESRFADDIQRYTDVDVTGKKADESAPKVFKVDIRDVNASTTLAFALGPDLMELMVLPYSVDKLVGSGATYVGIVQIFERDPTVTSEVTVNIPGRSGSTLVLPGVKSYTVKISKIVYPDPPKEDEDGF